MIIRRHNGDIFLISQHHHASISGTFAGHWKVTGFQGFDRLEEVLFTIDNHDRCWETADREPLFNRETGLPYSFDDYPEDPKIDLYKAGIDRMEKEHPYAALLCSKHFAAFFDESSTPTGRNFHASETTRQQRLALQAGLKGKDLKALDFHFRLLQFCDNLSLFICMNPPGKNQHPWFSQGLPNSEKLDLHSRPFKAVWKDSETVSLSPFPFDEPFSVKLEYKQLPADIPDQETLTRYWNEAPLKTRLIRFAARS